MRYLSGGSMNPLTPAANYRIADSIETDMAVVVTANSVDWRQLAKRADQITEFV
jgi:hypothetical protein